MKSTLGAYKIGLTVIGLFTVAMVGLLAMQAGATKQDAKTYAAAQTIADKLNSATDVNSLVPQNLAAIGVRSVPRTIQYTKLSDTSYTFCATYKAASSNFDANSAITQLVYSGMGVNASAGSTSDGTQSYLYLDTAHKKGENCQTVALQSYGSSITNSPVMVGSSSRGSATNADDVQRQMAIQALQTQVEAYFAQNDNYPSLTQMNDATWRTTNMPSLQSSMLSDPASKSTTLLRAPQKNAYSYAPTDAYGASCEAQPTSCAMYELTATLSDGSKYQKTALN